MMNPLPVLLGCCLLIPSSPVCEVVNFSKSCECCNEGSRVERVTPWTKKYVARRAGFGRLEAQDGDWGTWRPIRPPFPPLQTQESLAQATRAPGRRSAAGCEPGRGTAARSGPWPDREPGIGL